MPYPETEFRLEKSYSGTLNSSGVLTINTGTGPTAAGERWEIHNMSVDTKLSGAKSYARFTVYRGNADSKNQIDYTSQGSGDTSDSIIKLQLGEYLTFEWAGGSNGAVGTVRIEGIQYIRGRRAGY